MALFHHSSHLKYRRSFLAYNKRASPYRVSPRAHDGRISLCSNRPLPHTLGKEGRKGTRERGKQREQNEKSGKEGKKESMERR